MRSVAAAGLGLVEQLVDLGELLEHVGPVLAELFAAGVDLRAQRRGEQHPRYWLPS